MSFGIPVRNGLGLGLLPSTAVSSLRIGGRPAMFLNFIGTTSLSSMVTFSRGSNATLVDATGKITYAPANLLTWSQDFDNGAWTKGNTTVTANSTVAPDGTTTADTIAATTTAATFLFRDLAFPASAGTYSFYIKANNIIDATTSFLVQDTTAGNVTRANGLLTWATMTITGTGASIAAVGNGWYRVFLSSSSLVSGNTLRLWINTGSTVTAGHSFFLWGAQLEPVTYQTTPSTYNATTASAYYGPRFDYDPVTLAAKGLLIEEQRTNVVTYSEQLDNVAWTKTAVTVTANATTSPDGTVNADAIYQTAVSSVQSVNSAVFVATSGVTYTLSVYLKAGTSRFVQVTFPSTAMGATQYANIDLTNVTVTASEASTVSVNSVGNGWVRVNYTVAAVAPSNLSPFIIAINSGTAARGSTITGNAANFFYVYGVQVEAGSFATSYIPTVASTVTRSADVATMTGTNFSSWYNASAGTLFVSGTGYNAPTVGQGGTAPTAASLYAAAAASPYAAIAISRRDATTINSPSAFIVSDAGSVGADIQINTISWVGATVKAAVAWSGTTDAAFTANGAAVGTDNSYTLPTVDSFQIGRWGSEGVTGYWSGHIRQIAYYNTRLANATLQALTA